MELADLVSVICAKRLAEGPQTVNTAYLCCASFMHVCPVGGNYTNHYYKTL
jgi:hypothetical protein